MVSFPQIPRLLGVTYLVESHSMLIRILIKSYALEETTTARILVIQTQKKITHIKYSEKFEKKISEYKYKNICPGQHLSTV